MRRKFLCLSLFAILLLYTSCSEDSAVLEEYAIAENSDIRITNDAFTLNPGQVAILDVLVNDNYAENSNVRIIGISQPKNGYVEINDDNTITYTLGTPPSPAETVSTAVEQEANTEATNEVNPEPTVEPVAPEENPTPEENTTLTQEAESPSEIPVNEEPAPTSNENVPDETTENEVSEGTPTENVEPEVTPESSEIADGAEPTTVIESTTSETIEESTTEAEPATETEPTTAETAEEPATEDTFTYTTETENEDGSTTVETGEVTVTTEPETEPDPVTENTETTQEENTEEPQAEPPVEETAEEPQEETNPEEQEFPVGEKIFYVTVHGRESNDGKTQESSWPLQHALFNAKGGDTVYVRAGNYGGEAFKFENTGTEGNPIRIIGYANIPGDVVSQDAPTFKRGDHVDQNKMPIFESSGNQNTIALRLYGDFIEIENFQITGFATGIYVFGAHAKIKNFALVDMGNKYDNTTYQGFGIHVFGDAAVLENIFIENANAQAITISGSDGSLVKNSQVYTDNTANPTDYYYVLNGGTTNTVIDNCLAERAPNLTHNGHGFTLKDQATYNVIKNCTAIRTSFELNFSGVHHNTVESCFIYGVDTDYRNWAARLAILNGANNNLLKNFTIEDTWAAIHWGDNDDGFVGPGGDRDAVSCGYDNTFDGIKVRNTFRILSVDGIGNYNASAENNTFVNCDFRDFKNLAITFYPTRNIVFDSCYFSGGDKFITDIQSAPNTYTPPDFSFLNCSWDNVNFEIPN